MFSTGSFRFWGHFWRGSICRAQSKSATPVGVLLLFIANCSRQPRETKICQSPKSNFVLVSAVAEGCLWNLYFNGMKCNWNEEFHINPKAAETQQTKFIARHSPLHPPPLFLCSFVLCCVLCVLCSALNCSWSINYWVDLANQQKICQSPKSKFVLVSAVAEGWSWNSYFNGMKCNWNEKFHVNPKAAEMQQTKFNARHRIISRWPAPAEAEWLFQSADSSVIVISLMEISRSAKHILKTIQDCRRVLV